MRHLNGWRWLAIGWILFLVLSPALMLILPDPLTMALDARLAGPPEIVLGTDELGRPILSRLVAGTTQTLSIVGLATFGSIVIGAVLGGIAGWFGGGVRTTVTVLVAAVWSVPVAVFAVLILSVVEINVVTVSLVIALTNWVGSARILETVIWRARCSSVVKSMRALGFSTGHILAHAVLPVVGRPMAVLFGFGCAETLALESGLSFLGLSLPPPLPTWGGQMSTGISYAHSAWWVSAVPALWITITIASFNALADAPILKGAGSHERPY